MNKPEQNRLRHLAIIMDGNGRWAKDRGLPRVEGHRAGAKAVRKVIKGCRELGIEYLTLYAFSAENWQRPAEEVGQLMELLQRFLKERRQDLHKYKIRLLTIGELDRLSAAVRHDLEQAVRESCDYRNGTLILALSYGSRQEIVGAARRFAEDVAAGRAVPEELDEGRFKGYLNTAGIPDPDLIIRTSGEVRLSNFLLWQASYSELWFSETLWPDFNQAELRKAIAEFKRRHRRYGTRSQ